MRILKRLGYFALCGALILTTGCGSVKNESSSSKEEAQTKATTVVTTHAAPTKKPSEYGKIIALTFDDGPNTTTTDYVLDRLEKYKIKASFFLIGNNITDESAVSVKRAYNMGCEIDNHSKSHSYMNKMTAEEIKAEIKATSDKIKSIVGEAPKFFRPPYIAVNNTMFENVGLPFIAGYGCNDWDASVTVEERYKSVMEQAKDGAIILLHDAQGNENTVLALDKIIPALQKQGYEFVTVSELFYAKGVEAKTSGIVYSYANQTSMYA